jgi:hypothetical protein
MKRRGWQPLPWFARPAPRIRFIRDLSAVAAAAVSRSTNYPGGFHVELTLHPDGIEPRCVRIDFALGTPDIPRVHVDGPTDSPHRYPDGCLCMWYPNDPRTNRWVPQDGSAELITRIAVHLIREAWWRRTAEWIGAEVVHGRSDPHNDPWRSPENMR